ncbi:tRNA (guanosine(37)-N1)-methyltransferase TrmD [Facklamia miroungae]|uniref:tRNA (guanine-N(1)-)-methyltransferase n=1 Tax=Facklamia miroungae TaxID=120956 RepID=A0A1G7NX66_9LACT|nr:tRNA (guanosine(37)-N1)-methyltransferase TrmD [Facklamia miroungae]NKZ28501.1 tRNA (guanosine(37)-N1)-methyltransferase TrmD [Facklamia miroungae]SDF78622.1 tRNA (guanine37-N1)-methyltransferase [Facklamia miroungae]
MKVKVLTLFPQMFSPMNESLMKTAQEKGILEFSTYDFRDFAINKHGHVDDYPYGGGAGMLLRPEPIVECLESLSLNDKTPIILVDPIGKPFTQSMAQEWATKEELVFICGHYEGFDERIRSYVTEEVSLGDYVLTNGELPTMVMIDATVRLIPEVVGNAESIVSESFQDHLLEYPQYTRPQNFRGQEVPDVLLSGHHERIDQWRKKESFKRTAKRRPDILTNRSLSIEEEQWLEEFNNSTQI